MLTVDIPARLEMSQLEEPDSLWRCHSCVVLHMRRVVEALLAGGDVASAAILTPYAGQVRLLNRLAK